MSGTTPENEGRPSSEGEDPVSTPAALVAALAAVAVATALGLLARDHVAPGDVPMLYLLAIVVVAVRYARGPSLLAAFASVLAYNFFFVPPFHTLRVEDERNLLTFATMFVVGVLIGELVRRLRMQRAEAIERERRTVSLLREREALAEAARGAELTARTERMRSALLSAVSHDLRTPLAVITGAASTLRDGDATLAPAQRDELVDSICEEAERLERFVVGLLEMTRLESGALQVKREWVPVEELVGSALARLEGALAGRPVTTTLPDDLPLVHVDPVLFGQALYNLLDNATKHTPPGTPLAIEASVTGRGVRLRVSDRGPGLRAADVPHVFEKFFRGPGRLPGAGLGLAICRGLVEVHGGTIEAANADGGGAVFTIELPVEGAPPQVPDEAESPSGREVGV